MAYKIAAPVQGFTGISVGIAFGDGVGETDDPVKVAYFRRHGYVVTEIVDEPTPIAEAEQPQENDADKEPESEEKAPAKKAGAK